MTSLTFYSPQLPDGSTAPQEFEFNGFGCNGRNQSPALVWADVPLEARSLALTAFIHRSRFLKLHHGQQLAAARGVRKHVE